MSIDVLKALVRNPSTRPEARKDSARALYLAAGREAFDCESPEMQAALSAVINDIVAEWRAPLSSQLHTDLAEVRHLVNTHHDSLSRGLDGVHAAARSGDSELAQNLSAVSQIVAEHKDEFERLHAIVGSETKSLREEIGSESESLHKIVGSEAEKTSNVRLSITEQMRADRNRVEEMNRDLAARIAFIESIWYVRLAKWLRGLFR